MYISLIHGLSVSYRDTLSFLWPTIDKAKWRDVNIAGEKWVESSFEFECGEGGVQKVQIFIQILWN